MDFGAEDSFDDDSGEEDAKFRQQVVGVLRVQTGRSDASTSDGEATCDLSGKCYNVFGGENRIGRDPDKCSMVFNSKVCSIKSAANP